MKLPILFTTPAPSESLFNYMNYSENIKDLVICKNITPYQLEKVISEYFKLISTADTYTAGLLKNSIKTISKKYGNLQDKKEAYHQIIRRCNNPDNRIVHNSYKHYAINMVAAIISANDPLINIYLQDVLEPFKQRLGLEYKGEVLIRITHHQFNEGLAMLYLASKVYSDSQITLEIKQLSKAQDIKLNSILSKRTSMLTI